MLAELRQKLADLWEKTRKEMIYQQVDQVNVDRKEDYIPLVYGRHYMRLWLAHVYLATQEKLLQNWYPAVHAVVSFDFQGKAVEFPTVADATKANMSQNAQTGDVIAQNFVLTPLIPFNNGTVSLDAGLTAVKGANYLEGFINTLSDFSNLLAVTQFSSALGIAAPLAKGLQSLLSEGGAHLLLHDAFGANRTGGYWMAVRIADKRSINPSDLTVLHDQLRIPSGKAGATSPLLGLDYMLFRLEVTEQGPDYRSLTAIQDPMKEAHKALKELDEVKAEGFYRAAIIAAHEAPELSNADRIRVKTQLRDDYGQLKKDLGFAGLVDGEYDLTESMKRAISVDMALKEGDPSWDSLFDVP